MLELTFGGWFQCRLATGDDDHDHPRGERGWTFAFPGEPDLDRVIRFHDPVAPRSHGPNVGVFVKSVALDGEEMQDHALVGATVNLLDHPVFQGRSADVSHDAREPIVPFHLEIHSDGFRMSRIDRLDIWEPEELTRRKAKSFEQNSARVMRATGIGDFRKHRAERMAALENALNSTQDDMERERLTMRIRELAIQGDVREASLGFLVEYDFSLRHNIEIDDPQGILGGNPDTDIDWPIRFWMGGWDCDALTGYVEGQLSIPLRSFVLTGAETDQQLVSRY